MGQEICLITGVGPGTGKALVERFANAYQVAMLARNRERLQGIEEAVPNTKGYPCDVADPEQLQTTLAVVKAELGAPSVVIHNAVGGTFGNFLSIDPEALNRNFQINATALLRLAQATAPSMIDRGQGAILCTGNTAAYRGVENFAGFAPTKAAQRILCESMARHLGQRACMWPSSPSMPSSTCLGPASASPTNPTTFSASPRTSPPNAGTSPINPAPPGASTSSSAPIESLGPSPRRKTGWPHHGGQGCLNPAILSPRNSRP